MYLYVIMQPLVRGMQNNDNDDKLIVIDTPLLEAPDKVTVFIIVN